MNNPIVLKAPVGVTIKTEAKQEGGFVNRATTCRKVPTVVQIMGIWIISTASGTFTLSWVDSGLIMF